jgi:NADH:ubiquinone oxidoreductase subunit F (NADH-binding)
MALSGHVRRPGNYEMEWAKVSFRELLYDPRLGAGIRDDNVLKAFIPGRVSRRGWVPRTSTHLWPTTPSPR